MASQVRSNVSLNDFTTLQVLGKGTYGKVILVQKNSSGKLYAMKRIRKCDISRRNQIERTMAERSILEKVNHHYVVKLRYAFQSTTKLYFILDYCPGGELFYHISRNKYFDENRAKFYAACIILALEHLHSLDIIYRDLKPENVLIDQDGFAKITDFGLSKEKLMNSKAFSFCGTPEYLAPEVFARQGYGKSIDWWSVGCLIYEMLTGLPPFYDQERDKMFYSIMHIPPRYRAHFSTDAWDIINRLLNKNPEQRLGNNGADEIKQHEWFRDIDWRLLSQRQLSPPFIPQLQDPYDVNYFDNDFTRIPISMSPNDILQGSPDNNFPNFTYDEKDIEIEGI